METVCGICNTVRNASEQGISFQVLLNKVRKEFRKQELDVKLKSIRDKKLLSDEFYVNAYYDPEEDYNKETAIEIVIYHNFPKDIDWDRKHITDLLVQIFDALVHEYKHQRQSKKRSYKIFWPSSYNTHDYLSDPDELDAYSISIAIELCRNLGKYRALRYLPKISSLAKLKFNGQFVSPNLYAYVLQFGELGDPILKKLAKKVYIRIQKIDTDVIFV